MTSFTKTLGMVVNNAKRYRTRYTPARPIVFWVTYILYVQAVSTWLVLKKQLSCLRLFEVGNKELQLAPFTTFSYKRRSTHLKAGTHKALE